MSTNIFEFDCHTCRNGFGYFLFSWMMSCHIARTSNHEVGGPGVMATHYPFSHSGSARVNGSRRPCQVVPTSQTVHPVIPEGILGILSRIACKYDTIFWAGQLLSQQFAASFDKLPSIPLLLDLRPNYCSLIR